MDNGCLNKTQKFEHLIDLLNRSNFEKTNNSNSINFQDQSKLFSCYENIMEHWGKSSENFCWFISESIQSLTKCTAVQRFLKAQFLQYSSIFRKSQSTYL